MVTVFDGASVPLQGYWPGFVALALLAGCLGWKLSGRRLKWYVPVVIAVLGVLGGVVPVWDQMRVRHRLSSGEDLHVTRGHILQTWSISERRRDFSGSGSNSNRYKTVISEGFDVGQDRFSWVRGSCLSAAALCAMHAAKFPLVRGMEVEVTWFEDAAQGNEKRVVRLRARPM